MYHCLGDLYVRIHIFKLKMADLMKDIITDQLWEKYGLAGKSLAQKTRISELEERVRQLEGELRELRAANPTSLVRIDAEPEQGVSELEFRLPYKKSDAENSGMISRLISWYKSKRNQRYVSRAQKHFDRALRKWYNFNQYRQTGYVSEVSERNSSHRRALSNLKSAFYYCEKAIHADPNNLAAYSMLYTICLNHDYSPLTDPGDVSKLYGQVSVALLIPSFDSGISVLRETIKLNPNAKLAYLFLGEFFSSKNMHDSAIVVYKQLIELAPNDPECIDAYVMLGSEYEKTGMTDQAISTLERALEVGPLDVTAKLFLEELKRKRPNTAE